MTRPWNKRRWAPALAAASALVLALILGVSPASTADTQNGRHGGGAGGPKPTVVLVHGAFADSSGWSQVGKALQEDGYPVLAFSNPLRDVQYDSEYLRSFLGTIQGPVVLVGHSYGGALITNAATGNPNVKSLVYIAAFALDEGETVQAALSLGGGHTEVVDHLIVRPFPGAAEGNGDAYIDPAYFPQLFAQDLPRAEARFMAASQRPAALATLVTPSGEPAWKTIPSWYMVASRDRIIPPEAERAMAKRAGATTVEVKSSHVPMLSNPAAVTSLIKKAAR
ncbi:alpha/beta hydrolase [Arthrobacter sp. Sa2CUA1]|uniref:Alpha/beta hydrolase n=1 Tax=Arthrobacter gallicola TaxID=2762225 RepID=A0ABR8UVR0_9MICC|nr:alpha/beta hydrolase [Arthrobacter gallicola]MBD7996639.1 alpha/beta hydrolase [Arthrobacter gallicola]